MTFHIQTQDIALDGVTHKWSGADSKCPAYGIIRFGPVGRTVTVFLSTTAEVDKVIAELVALRAEMDPPPAGPGGVLFNVGDEDEDGPMDDEAELRRADAIRDEAACRSCEIEPATEGDFCEACAPAVLLATGTLDAAEVTA
jgi:hypothetical protein